MKIFMTFIVLLSLSNSAFAGPSVPEILNRINQFVSSLNARFLIDVTPKMTEECGFRAEETDEVKDVYEINFCHKDLNFFSELSDTQLPLEGVLSIIAHEYAHFLLDFDGSYEAFDVFEDNLFNSAAAILAENIDNKLFLEKLLAIHRSLPAEDDPEGIPVEHKYNQVIYHVLLLGTHENVDTLSIKLLHMMKTPLDPTVMRHLPALTGTSSDFIDRMVKARTNMIMQSYREGLVAWNNFLCMGDGLDRDDFRPALKRLLIENEYFSLLSSLNQSCPQKKISEDFDTLLRRYYP